MILQDHDVNQIILIDEQTTLLLAKEAPDTTILETLNDFIPEVCCLLEETDLTRLKPYLERYEGFAHFVSLIQQLKL